MELSLLRIDFSNDYFPSHNRYNSIRWEEDEHYVMKMVNDSLTDKYSIIHRQYRAMVDAGIDSASIHLRPYCTPYQRVELDSRYWSMYFDIYNHNIYPEWYFRTEPSTGRMIFREYVFDIMRYLGCCEAYIIFNPYYELKNITHSRFPRYTIEDYSKGKKIPQLFRDTFDDCYTRLEELQRLFPAYVIDSISVLGESILPVKKEEQTILIDIKTQDVVFDKVIEDYQMVKDNIYIASGNEIIVCNSQCQPIKTYKLSDWDNSCLQ